MQAELCTAVGKIRQIVGEAYVIADDAEVANRTRDISLWHRQAGAIVYPADSPQVSAVVKVANEYKIPVWCFSKGKNWGYGATMPYHDGALIMVLDRMNRILEVNEELAFAVIEPGVSQGQLNAYLKAHHSRLWADCTDSTPQGSVIGNALERGVGYTPYWDHFGHLCGLEVVLANGEIVRTGGGPANSLTWHLHKWGLGPYIEGLFSQSNFGIVTRAGVWLMPAPEYFSCFICELDDERNWAPMVDNIRGLTLCGMLPANVHIVNEILFLAQLIPYPRELLVDRTYLTDENRAALRARYKIARWTVTGGLYGSPAQVRVMRKAVASRLGRFGKVRFFNDRAMHVFQVLLRIWEKMASFPLLPELFVRLSGSSLEKAKAIPNIYPILKGIPGEHILGFAYFKLRGQRPAVDLDPARDGAGMLWVALVCPLTGRHTQMLLDLCTPLFHKHGFDLSLAFLMVNSRVVLPLIEIFYDKTNPDEAHRAQALYNEVTMATAAAGFQQYRTSVAYSDRILQPAPEFQKLLNTMRNAIDPNNIIAPGHYGIGLR